MIGFPDSPREKAGACPALCLTCRILEGFKIFWFFDFNILKKGLAISGIIRYNKTKVDYYLTIICLGGNEKWQ